MGPTPHNYAFSLHPYSNSTTIFFFFRSFIHSFLFCTFSLLSVPCVKHLFGTFQALKHFFTSNACKKFIRVLSSSSPKPCFYFTVLIFLLCLPKSFKAFIFLYPLNLNIKTLLSVLLSTSATHLRVSNRRPNSLFVFVEFSFVGCSLETVIFGTICFSVVCF